MEKNVWKLLKYFDVVQNIFEGRSEKKKLQNSHPNQTIVELKAFFILQFKVI